MIALAMGVALGAVAAPVEATGAPFITLSIDGLADGEARPGTHSSVSVPFPSGVTAWIAQAWGSATHGDATYGSGTNPADFSAGDGSLLVWEGLGDDGLTYRASAPIRHAMPVSVGGLIDRVIVLGDTSPIPTAEAFVFLGSPAYSLSQAPTGMGIDPETGQIDASSVTEASGSLVVVRLADAYATGRYAESDFRITLEDFTLSETVDAEIEIAGVAGSVTVTVASPAAYADHDAGNGAGVFIFDTADLATGPVNLVPPQILDDGSPDEGDVLTLVPGLWVYEPGNGNLTGPSYQWRSDLSDIPGAISETFALSADEAGSSVDVVETLSDNGGSRTSASLPIDVASGGERNLWSDDFSTDTIAAGDFTNTTDFEVVEGEMRRTGDGVAVQTLVSQPAVGDTYFVEMVLGDPVPSLVRMYVGRGGGGFGCYLLGAGTSFSIENANEPYNTFAQLTLGGTLAVGDTMRLEVNALTQTATAKVNGAVPDAVLQDVDIAIAYSGEQIAYATDSAGRGISSWSLGEV